MKPTFVYSDDSIAVSNSLHTYLQAAITIQSNDYLPYNSSAQSYFIEDMFDYSFFLSKSIDTELKFIDSFTKQTLQNITFSLDTLQYNCNHIYSGKINLAYGINIYNSLYSTHSYNITPV